MSATLDLAIMTRVAAGSGLTIHQPHEEQYTYAAIAIATAVGMLKHQATRGVLVNIALIYDTTRCGDQLFGRDPRLAVQAVDNFIRKIDSRFPMVTIERRLTNLDCIAYHDRCEWEGTQQSWDPRSSMVGLNTVKFNAMINAAGDSQVFREYQFQFAAAIFHEVGGHMLITYLGNGGRGTPPTLSAHDYQRNTRRGEPGRYLELSLFGGTLEFYKETASTDTVKGVAHLIGADGFARKVDDSVFRDVMDFDGNPVPNFSFPFRTTGSAIHPRTLSSMGRGMPVDAYMRDMQTMMAQRPPSATLSGSRFRVRVKDIKSVLSDRRKRLRAC